MPDTVSLVTVEREEYMTVLVVGASGATGRLLARQLLDRGQSVRAIVRSPEKLTENIGGHDRLTVIRASVLDLDGAGIARHVDGCEAVASCLGHNLNLGGIYGRPRMLVTDATRRLCDAIKAHKGARPTRFVLMNTAGNGNRDLVEPISLAQKCVMGLLRRLLPPLVDNEEAADYLRAEIGQDHREIEWAVVRPDTLVNENVVTGYEVHPSPIRSALFNPGRTSRINVAHFMADLITDDETWNTWKGRMPVIYNVESRQTKERRKS